MKKTLGTLLISLTAAVALTIPTLGSGAGQTVQVKEVEYRIALSARPRAGLVKFVIRNVGDDPHNFALRGGGRRWSSRVVGAGASSTLTARLKKGVRYSYWCVVGDHAQKGMRGSFVAR